MRPDGFHTDETTQDPSFAQRVVGHYKTITYTYATEVNESLLTTNMDERYLFLANKENPMERDYAPSDVVELTDVSTKSIELEAGAANALYEMMRELRAAGIKDVFVTSGFRSYDYQNWLFNYYIQEEQRTISKDAYACLGAAYIRMNYLDLGKTTLDYADARRVVESYSAEPGKSEHQTGLCVDFITSSMEDLTVEFENTDAFAWLSKNAYRFGFILRYPKGRENITGYTYEPWHYRFVGREAATDIYYADLTLEEYLPLLEH